MFEFLVRDYAILIALIIACASIVSLFSLARIRVWNEPDVRFRWLSRAIIAQGIVTAIWITVFDDWRKFLGEPTGWLQDEDSRIASDPFLLSPVDGDVRFITWLLFGIAVIGGAFLFARYARGLVEPIILGPLAVIMFFIINTFRLRFDVDSVRIAYGSIDGPVEILSTLTWVVGLWISMSILILAFYAMLWAPVALAFSVFTRAVFREEPPEAPIFKRISERKSSFNSTS